MMRCGLVDDDQRWVEKSTAKGWGAPTKGWGDDDYDYDRF